MLFVCDEFDLLDPLGPVHSKAAKAVLTSVSSLALWFRLLYFFRIFDSTGFLIRAILAVVYDMRHFLVILGIAICGFGDSFRVMSLANVDNGKDGSANGRFITGSGWTAAAWAWLYSYDVALGEFGDNWGKVAPFFVLILWTLNTLATTVIMLNLFIAIISESFEKINSKGLLASYREKAGLIAENQFLLSAAVRKGWCEPHKYLLYAQSQRPEEELETAEYRQHQLIVMQADRLDAVITNGFEEARKKQTMLTGTLKKIVSDALADSQSQKKSEDKEPKEESARMGPLKLASLSGVEVQSCDDAAQQKAANNSKSGGGVLGLGVFGGKKEGETNTLTASKLLLSSEGRQDKWSTDAADPWVVFKFDTPIVIKAYGLKAGNEFVFQKAPRRWKVQAKLVGSNGNYEVIHEVRHNENIRFNGAW